MIHARVLFISALMSFDDRCGGFYSHRAYFLAAAGLAEFPQSIHAQSILAQLLQWRFGVFPPSVCEGARVALLQTDRTLAIAALEQFIQITENPFARWQSAYTLGKTLDPGNPLAIAALTQLSDTLQNETLRLQVLESLGKIAPDYSVVMQSLEQLLASTQQGNVRRRAAYSLGKMNAGHPKAIATLEQIIQSTTNATLRLRTAENLLTLDPAHALAMAVLASMQKPLEKTSRKRLKAAPSQDLDHLITTLEHRLATATDAAHQRRLAYRLATLQPGHPQAIDGLLQLLLAKETPTLYKRVVEDLKAVVLEPQLAKLVSQLSVLVANANASTSPPAATQLHECHKLLWYCAQHNVLYRLLACLVPLKVSMGGSISRLRRGICSGSSFTVVRQALWGERQQRKRTTSVHPQQIAN